MPTANSQQPVGTESGKGSDDKILIVTYYWPPSGGSGVQRWLKFVKYLPGFGWHPYVFTPENPSFEIRDDTLLRDIPAEAEVLRFPIWEPYGAFNKLTSFTGSKPAKQTDRVTTGRKGFVQSVTTWVRGNFFIPDPRIFWVRPSVKFLRDWLKSNGIRTIVTTGPPHSMHLIGLRLKRADTSIRWIADFRDPWSEWDLLDTLSLSQWARRRHRILEKHVLKEADEVITIAPYHVRRLESIGQRKVNLVTNGFDEEDFRTIEKRRTEKFTIRHIGMVDELRDPRPFMEAVKELARESMEFSEKTRIEFIGSVNSGFIKYVAADSALSMITTFADPIPHKELVKLYGETDMQLLVLAHTVQAPGNLPGKFFEYLASGNFVFAVGPENGDAAHILRATHAGSTVDRNNQLAIRRTLMERFVVWKNGDHEERRDVSTFSRKNLTEQLNSVLRRA